MTKAILQASASAFDLYGENLPSRGGHLPLEPVKLISTSAVQDSSRDQTLDTYRRRRCGSTHHN